ncbi:MAG: MFS transporter [Candidatus Andeanibacterium colombiense]|uniref:MFS transporter n=1 Tax=Candidatus Andeanibacterium colombiense TaxID=3121345 RepID=A0AAJ5XCM1_9SPHN|nr:MAG: MFS transporter [Sphingomonadaceae bacterium]
MEQATHGPAKPSPSNLAAIAICTAIFFLDGLIHTVIGPMAPGIARDMALGKAALGPIFSANLIGQTLGLLGFPLLARRFGHRATVIFAVFGFCLAQIATALAWNGGSLFAFRLIDGIFLGGCMPSCLVITTKLAPPGRLGLAMMALFTGYGSGATVSGILASVFLGNGGWRISIALVGAMSLLNALAAIVWLRGVDEFPSARQRAKPVIRALDVLAPRLLGGTLMLWLMFMAMLTVQYCLSSWLPTLLVELGRDPSFAALSVTIFSLGGIIAALGVGILIDRFGGTPVLGGFLLIATVLLFITGQVLATASAGVLMALLISGGFFFLGAYGGINYLLATYYEDDLRAIGIGLTKSIGRVGTILAPVLIGYGLLWGVRQTTIMSLFAVPSALATAAVFVVGYLVRHRARSKQVHRNE